MNNGQERQLPVDLNAVIGKLTEQIARLSFELAMTQAALEGALSGGENVDPGKLDEKVAGN